MVEDDTRPPVRTPSPVPVPASVDRAAPDPLTPGVVCQDPACCFRSTGLTFRGHPGKQPTAQRLVRLVNPLGRIPDAAPLRGTKSGNISPPLRSHSRGLASKQVCGELGDRRGRWGPGFQRLARISKGFAVRRAQGESSLMKSRVTRCVLIDERSGGPGATHISPGFWRGTLWTD